MAKAKAPQTAIKFVKPFAYALDGITITTYAVNDVIDIGEKPSEAMANLRESAISGRYAVPCEAPEPVVAPAANEGEDANAEGTDGSEAPPAL
jgi:hypothetical protein